MENKIITIKIEDIIMDNRIRKDMGDLEAFANEIKVNGMMNYPLISTDNHLIAGERRVRACQLLGLTKITVRQTDITDAEKLTELEIAENLLRKDFTRSERVDCGIRLERIEAIKAEKRMKAGKANPEQNSDEGSVGRTADIVARRLGISRDTYAKEKKIVENRDKLPAEVFEKWDKGVLSTHKVFNMLPGISENAKSKKTVSKTGSTLHEDMSVEDLEEEISRLRNLRYDKMISEGVYVMYEIDYDSVLPQIEFYVDYDGGREVFFKTERMKLLMGSEKLLRQACETTPLQFINGMKEAIEDACKCFAEQMKEFASGTYNFGQQSGNYEYQYNHESQAETSGWGDGFCSDGNSYSESTDRMVSIDDVPAAFIKKVSNEIVHLFNQDSGAKEEDAQYAILLRKYLRQQWKIA